MGDTFYGYIRVSSKDQNGARQIHAVQEFGVTKENMVFEKHSSKDFQHNRQILRRMDKHEKIVVE